MRNTPLIGPYSPDDVVAWKQGQTRTARRFLGDVVSLAESLPDRPTVFNLVDSRYEFAVGFAAAILRGQLTLLPQRRAPEAIRRLSTDYPGSYLLTDHDEVIEGIDAVRIQSEEGPTPWPKTIPRVPLDQIVAIAFTSGSTGHPVPNKKTWGALTAVAQATGARLGIKEGDRIGVVATVPHQHMFGLEASVMLPLIHGLPMYSGRPLFPADVGSIVAETGGRWMLVTTPLHLRACVTERMQVPAGGLILSATAPLARELAQEAERMFHAQVHEIFGFAEAGSVAERRTVNGDHWMPLEGVAVEQAQGMCTVQAWYLPASVQVPDHVTVESNGSFVLHGRKADQVNIAGHRVSLGHLNQTLLRIDGVQDGVFFLPEEESGPVTRLMAFVVAPGKTSEEIQHALRAHLDSVFLPRPLVCVPSLPRNATGKLPREAVLELARQWAGKAGHDL